MEHIKLQLGPIYNADIDLRRLTVLFGEGSGGKSFLAKQIGLCRTMPYNYKIYRDFYTERHAASKQPVSCDKYATHLLGASFTNNGDFLEYVSNDISIKSTDEAIAVKLPKNEKIGARSGLGIYNPLDILRDSNRMFDAMRYVPGTCNNHVPTDKELALLKKFRTGALNSASDIATALISEILESYEDIIFDLPETFLTTEKQFDFVNLLSIFLNEEPSSRFIVVTNSTFILKAMQALMAFHKADEICAVELNKTISPMRIHELSGIDSENVNVLKIDGFGKVKSIIKPDTDRTFDVEKYMIVEKEVDEIKNVCSKSFAAKE